MLECKRFKGGNVLVPAFNVSVYQDKVSTVQIFCPLLKLYRGCHYNMNEIEESELIGIEGQQRYLQLCLAYCKKEAGYRREVQYR